MLRIKKSLVITLAILWMATTLAFSHHSTPAGTWAEIQNLPSELHLSASQISSFNTYLNTYRAGFNKDHQIAVGKIKKILTKEQLSHQKIDDILIMTAMNPQPFLRSDEQVNAIIDGEAQKLLLTSNQTDQFKMMAIEFHHQKHQLWDNFSSQLSRILTATQQQKFARMMP